MGTTGDLARYVVDSTPERIPDALIHEGKRCLINFLAVAIYASRDPSLDILLDVFDAEGGSPLASVVGTGVRTTLQNAALANGYLGHLEDYDDTHFPTVIHPSSPVLPAALALGEHLHASGRDVLAASVLGMEACCRIGMAVHPYHYDEGWHITGTTGVFGSIIAAGKLSSLDIDQVTHGLGIAGTQAAGVREVFGSMTKPFHPGRSAQSGVLASLLAQRGFTSTTEILEGRRGFAAVMSEDSHLERVNDGLGESWELMMNGLKPYACGVVNHPLIDAMVALKNETGIDPEGVQSVTARVHPLVLELVDRPNPRLGLEGKFSYQHSMAVGLVDGAAFPAQYSDARVADSVIAGLRDKIHATIDESMAEDAAEVTITLRNGQEHTQRIEHATGAPENPMTDAQLNEKFKALVGDVFPNDQVEGMLSALWNLDQASDVAETIALTRVADRTVRE